MTDPRRRQEVDLQRTANWASARLRALLPSEPSPPPPGCLVDDFVDTYVDWREECEGVRAAYQRWAGCERPDRFLAFVAYRAALDREERAARVHGECAQLLVGGMR